MHLTILRSLHLHSSAAQRFVRPGFLSLCIDSAQLPRPNQHALSHVQPTLNRSDAHVGVHDNGEPSLKSFAFNRKRSDGRAIEQ